MAAYQGDNSEEAQQRIQQIKVELENAREDLQETEYEKMIDDTQKMLDDLYLEYETILNMRLDNLDALIENAIAEINANASTISATLYETADSVGFTLSDSTQTIWTNINGAIADYGSQFTSLQTGTNTALKDIKSNLQSILTALDAKAKTNIQTAGGSSAADEQPTTKTLATSNDDKQETKTPTVTNNTLRGIAAAIWVYGTGSGWGNAPNRGKRLTEKLGSSNASKVQSYINSEGPSGKLYNFWVQNGKNLDKYKYNNFKFGVKNIGESQFAWTQENGKEFIVRPSDGAILTPIAKGDSVLTSAASNNIWSMANSPADFIKDNLGIGSASVPSAQNVNNSIVQNFENITFSMPNVHGYNDLLREMQRDPKFEKLILSMTIDQIAGKSSLAKGKSIR